jgi:hypothetical protein
MANATPTPGSTPPTPRKRRRWLRILGLILGIFLVLLVVVYFVGTSSGFVKSVILPRVSKSVNADITVSDASISPFKQVILQNLKVQVAGQEPVLTAPEVRLRYSLMDIIGGNIHVDEVTISSPIVTLVENPDGTKNLPPESKSQKEKPAEKPKAESKPPQIDLKKLLLSDATVRQIKVHKNGKRDVAELSHVNVNLENVKNGQTGKLTLDADIKMDNNPPSPATNGLLEAKLKGNFDFALSADLKPASIKGNTHLGVTRAAGALSDLATFATDLDCEVTPTDVRQVALRFQKSGVHLGELRVNGPLDMEKSEGRLTVQLLSIDKQLLNLAGAAQGLDFGPTAISSSNEIQLAKSGKLITAAGRFDVNKLQVTRTNQTTPSLDFRADYDVSVDLAASNALVRVLNLTGTQKGTQFLRGELSSPMNLAWGNTANAVGDSTLNFSITGFDLADWKPFLGDSVTSGIVGTKTKLLSQQGGKLITFESDSRIDNLTAGSGSNQIMRAAITAHAAGKATDLKQFNLSDYRLQVTQDNQPLLTVTGMGTVDNAKTNADLQVTVQASLAQLLKAKPQTNVMISSGTLELKARVVQKQDNQTITGNLVLADLTGRSGDNEFRSFGTKMELDINKAGPQIQIRKVAGTLSEGGNTGGGFDLSGNYNVDTKAAQLTAKLTDFNQNGLRPFLEPMLTDKKLVSVAINATAAVQYNPQADSSIKADFKMANLVVNDPKNQIPATPLEAKAVADVSLRKNVTDIRQCQLTLTPTSRAKNELNVTGHVDSSQSNAITGNLKLAADSLDMTTYYHLFAGGKKPEEKTPTAAPKPQPATPAANPADANKEPDAKQLPFRNFLADAAIGRFYLDEVEITNLLTKVKIDGGHVLVDPCKLALNGAPVSTKVDLDLGVPGYKYDVAFNAQGIPLAPFVNTFQPERKGQIGGAMTAQAKISGAGTTGANLKKTLAGQFDVNSTNLNLSVVNIRSTLLKRVINVVATIPELVKNPASVVGAVFGKGGLSEDLAKSPIDTLMVRGVVGAGKMELQQSVVQSAAFKAEATGTLALADVLTNSTIHFPVSISLNRGMAEKFGLVPANTPTNEAYAKLPDFVTMTGTVGDPKEQINKIALAGTAFKTVGSIVGGFGGKTGGIIKNAGDLLTGQRSATNAPATGGTNQSPANNLLDQFFKPKKK